MRKMYLTCGFMRVFDNALKVNNEIAKPAALTVLKSFNLVDGHYTLQQGDDLTSDYNVLDDDDDKIDDLDEVMEVDDENMPCFNSIT